MPQVRGFSRHVPRRSAFGTAIQGFRRARRRAILAAVVVAIRQILSVREIDPDLNIGGPDYNDEEVLDEYLRGHERGFRLGLRRGHERGYRRGVAVGFEYGLRQGYQTGYEDGYNDGAANGSD